MNYCWLLKLKLFLQVFLNSLVENSNPALTFLLNQTLFFNKRKFAIFASVDEWMLQFLYLWSRFAIKLFRM